jgi:phosphoglycerate kinase
VATLSLAPVAKRLGRLLEKKITLTPDCTGKKTKEIVMAMKPGDIVLLENLRFNPGEKENSDKFGRKLGELAEVYINDAFATAHRAHASNVAVVKYVKDCAAGLLMKKELSYFSRAMKNPMRPFVAIVGGKKVSDKVGLLASLCDRVDKLIIGGGMALTFFKALGYEVGKSFAEDKALDTAKAVIKKAQKRKIKLYLPVDFVVADRFTPSAETKVVTYQEIPSSWMALDVGPATVTLFDEAIQNAKTIIWNGPMGVFEMDAFSRGTFAMVSNVANSYALTIVGGGDTDVAVHRAGEYAKMSYISTGGGAFLELLQHNDLPAIAALRRRKKPKRAAAKAT